MTARGAVAACAALAALCTLTRAETAPEAPRLAPAPTAALAKLLAAPGEDGEPVVTPKARAYFDALPERAREQTERAIADELVTSPQHLAAILDLGLPAATLEFALGDRCFVCHSDPEVHSGDTLFARDPATAGIPAHMALAGVVQDTHFRRGLSCAGCHGGDPTDPMGHDHVASWPEDTRRRREDRAWIPEFCGRCHADSAFMRQFDPALPTDQLAKFRQSRHGIVLASGDSRAAQCVSCHGVHGILGAKSPRSSVYPTRVPDTCGACHGDARHMAGFPTDQVEQYRHSVHGRALLDHGDLGAPACNDCHGNHAALPPEVASVSQVCRTCHARNGELFDGSKHKQAFLAHGWAECDVCHGKHAIERTSDAMLAPGPASLCSGCHAQYARDNPACNASAAYFHQSLLRLADGHARLSEHAEHLARQGLDIDAITGELSTLFDSLAQARSYVHAFDRSEFDQAAAPGRASIQRVASLEAAARDELDYRRLGLGLAVVLIGLLMVLLRIKLRRMESSSRD